MIFALLALLFAASPLIAQTAPPPPPPPGGPMMRADTNGDGVITRDEALAQAAQRFDRMDLNHDGRLTPDELGRVREHMRPMRDGDLPPPPPPAPAPGQ